MNNQKKLVLITGAAKRIGAAIAKYFHLKDYNIVLHYHGSEKEAYHLFDELNTARPNSVSVIQADLTDISVHIDVLNTVQEKWGRLDVLINNASEYFPTPFHEAREEDWEKLININLKAPFFLSKAASKLLSNSKGSIINLTDAKACQPEKDFSVYKISKSALVMLTQSLALELAPDVTVNGIAPGVILWPENEEGLDKTKTISNIPLQKMGSPLDIARTAYFLSEEGKYIHGEIIKVDGGANISL